jgi:RNA polymerase sigma-70 factor (ECF subfamily)
MADEIRDGPKEMHGQTTSTSTSLLQRLKARDEHGWQRLLTLYGPTVYGWCRHAGLSAEDAADVGQVVFEAVARSIADFRRERPGDSFRGWVWTITRNKIRDLCRRNAGRPEAVGGSVVLQQMLQIPDPVNDDSVTAQTAEETQGLYHRALELIQTEFAEKTWRAFLLVTVEGKPAADVAAELGMSLGAVYIAKSRVLGRLREEFGELVS